MTHPTPTKAAFAIGDLVQKAKGSRWRGRVVGTYSTELTPEGYAVESSTEKGSVQIYPASALVVATPAPMEAPAEAVAEVSARGFSVEPPFDSGDPAFGLVRWNAAVLWPGTKLYTHPAPPAEPLSDAPAAEPQPVTAEWQRGYNDGYQSGARDADAEHALTPAAAPQGQAAPTRLQIELLWRLRQAGCDYTLEWGSGELYDEAADEIERLSAAATAPRIAAPAAEPQAREPLSEERIATLIRKHSPCSGDEFRALVKVIRALEAELRAPSGTSQSGGGE
jgi:hypothetical protein